MVASVVSLFQARPRARDWSNQEMAEFFRVTSALGRLGIEIETDRGLTDEGDPWFVFCREDTGDVVIHFAKIDGLYVVAAAFLERPLKGKDFRALIEALLEQYGIVSTPVPQRGVQRIFIHPSAMLTALVATFYVLFEMRQEAQAATRDGQLSPEAKASLAIRMTEFMRSIFHETAANDPQDRFSSDDRDRLGFVIAVVATAASITLDDMLHARAAEARVLADETWHVDHSRTADEAVELGSSSASRPLHQELMTGELGAGDVDVHTSTLLRTTSVSSEGALPVARVEPVGSSGTSLFALPREGQISLAEGQLDPVYAEDTSTPEETQTELPAEALEVLRAVFGGLVDLEAALVTDPERIAVIEELEAELGTSDMDGPITDPSVMHGDPDVHTAASIETHDDVDWDALNAAAVIQEFVRTASQLGMIIEEDRVYLFDQSALSIEGQPLEIEALDLVVGIEVVLIGTPAQFDAMAETLL